MAKSSTSFKKGHKTGVGKTWKVKDTTKMSLSHIGKKPTEKQLEALKLGRKKGRTWRIKDTSKMRGKVGDKNPNWNGGTSYEPYSVDWTKTLKRAIRERDKYTCQLCNIQPDDTLSVHHIDYDKKNCSPNNLISLCRICHNKTQVRRDYWKEYFYGKNL